MQPIIGTLTPALDDTFKLAFSIWVGSAIADLEIKDILAPVSTKKVPCCPTRLVLLTEIKGIWPSDVWKGVFGM